jgi:uncharacterized protein DUF3800
MISAYFDDSGTHTASDVIVVAGVLATEGRLELLERGWKRELANPIEGRKRPLKRFHMTDCFSSRGEYAGWSRTETDYHCRLLRELMIGNDISAYGVACSRKDYDEFIRGDLRDVLGTPEGFCIRNCFVRSLAWMDRTVYDPEIRFVFDDRPTPVKHDAAAAYDAYERIIGIKNLRGISFEGSLSTILLQAADLVAWEFYQHAKDVLAEGQIPIKRGGFNNLAREIKFDGQIADRRSIEDMWENVWKDKDPEMLRQVGAHFRMFDPDDPDYSYLSAA